MMKSVPLLPTVNSVPLLQTITIEAGGPYVASHIHADSSVQHTKSVAGVQ
jgi:hypothetical protein